MRFNRRHGHWGHLFGGRYKAQLVDERDPCYLRTLFDYVHLNPFRAGERLLLIGQTPWDRIRSIAYVEGIARRIRAWWRKRSIVRGNGGRMAPVFRFLDPEATTRA